MNCMVVSAHEKVGELGSHTVHDSDAKQLNMRIRLQEWRKVERLSERRLPKSKNIFQVLSCKPAEYSSDIMRLCMAERVQAWAFIPLKMHPLQDFRCEICVGGGALL